MDDKVTISLITIIVVRELWDIVKKSVLKKDDDLKANTEATIKNTLAIEYLRDDVAKLHKLPIDVNESHSKIRALEDRVKILEQ